MSDKSLLVNVIVTHGIYHRQYFLNRMLSRPNFEKARVKIVVP